MRLVKLDVEAVSGQRSNLLAAAVVADADDGHLGAFDFGDDGSDPSAVS